jgi:glutamyl-tRNA reductase
MSGLRDRRIGKMYLMNRSQERAEEFARLYGGKTVEWGAWDAALKLPDIIVSAIGVQEPLLSKELIERAMSSRGNKALFLMDLGMPRNIEAAVADIYNTYLYTMDDLSEIVQQNSSARQSEVPKAEALVEEQLGKFMSWQASVELTGMLDLLRSNMRQRQAAFLRDKFAVTNHFNAEEREQIGRILDEMVEQLLIAPAERLRAEKEHRRKIQNVEAIRDLFLNDREKP